jgi:sulfate adenylyltransferase
MVSIPHGGKLTPRLCDPALQEELKKQHHDAPVISAMGTVSSDLELMAVGAMAPLTGFMNRKEYRSVVEDMRLINGLVWTLPITAPIPPERIKEIESKGALWFREGEEEPHALMILSDLYEIHPEEEASKVFGTTDTSHPAVKRLFELPRWRAGGEVHVLRIPLRPFLEYRKTPEELRRIFHDRGFETISAFQTRNPIHRAHEYLTKVALEITDGLLLHPLVGETKEDDIPAGIRMRCYEVLLEKYYNKEKVVLSVFPAAMRYGGPREAIFHAIIRKNYGCTHFIVGRDHAGVGNFYGPYDAQKIFSRFTPEELGITPLKFENAFYCLRTKQMATTKTSPSTPEERITLSGTQVRQMLRQGKKPPEEFTRPEVAEILIQAMREKGKGEGERIPSGR